MESSPESAAPGDQPDLPAGATTYGLDRPIVFLILALNLGFVALGLYLIFLNRNADLLEQLIGLFCAGFFGLTLVTWLADLSIRGPVLVIDRDGLWDKRMSRRPIPWTEIRDAYIRKVKYTRFINLDLVDPKPYLPSPLSFRGLLARLNPMMGYSAMTIATLPLTGSAQEVLSTIEGYRAQAASSDPSSSRR